MIFLEVLVEGSSDVPAAKEILQRKFGLVENESFRIHAHRGKGELPKHPHAQPDRKRQGLLDQLPAKLRGYSGLPVGYCLIVLVDADNDNCYDLKRRLVKLYEGLNRKPTCVLFRIAVEETESWFLADTNAIHTAYPQARINRLPDGTPDQIIGAWEKLAEVIGLRPNDCDGSDKKEWASKISPHLDLDHPKSPSLRAFVEGIAAVVAREATA